MNFKARQKNLREHLATSRFDGLLVSHLPNIRYLCGFTGSAGLLLVQESGSVFITDVRYDTQAHDEVKGAKIIIARKALLEALAEVLAQRKTARRKRAIAIESEHLSVAEKKRLIKFRPASITLKDASAIVEKARMSKDDEELQLIRAAVALGANRNAAVIISRDFGDATAYSMIERDDDGHWRLRWTSARRHC